MNWQFFHRVGPNVAWLDHHIAPEIRAMFAAMVSRAPGGIEVQYQKVVCAIAMEDFGHSGLPTRLKWDDLDQLEQSSWMDAAEMKLTTYPLPAKATEFFEKFVGQYGHSSCLELTGSPVVFIEGISTWFAYLTFDNPLVKGQEMSTRACWRDDWPMGDDLRDVELALQGYHRNALDLAKREIEAWKIELQKPCKFCAGNGYQCEICVGTGRKYSWMKDPQPFRPAFDRARWAIPGTVATGVAHTADLRTMARVIQQLEDYATASGRTAALPIIEQIKEAYRQALPGMAGMGLREAVYTDERPAVDRVPESLWHRGGDTVSRPTTKDEFYCDISIGAPTMQQWADTKRFPAPTAPKTYLDPIYNFGRLEFTIPCSYACARDWHRQRTAYPWEMRSNVDADNKLGLHPWYRQLSTGEYGVNELFQEASDLFNTALHVGDKWLSNAILPLGTLVDMHASAGLRDAKYIFELRANAHGGNFEYARQAKEVLEFLDDSPEFFPKPR